MAKGRNVSIVAELKRRSVLKVGLAYLVMAWLALQVSDVILGNFAAPDWVFKSILLVLIVAFPFVLLGAWVYELTPAGVKRDQDDGESKWAQQSGRHLILAIVGSLLLAAVYFAFDRYSDGGNNIAIDLPATEKSIAVLPFRNRSGLAGDVHFVDGIHDDILTQLAKLSALEKVISRTSTEQYRGTTKSVPQIGQELGVATVLEGGVQRAGDRVRINLQLINATTDEHLWADTYDRQLTVENLFAIQSEITHEVVNALQAVLSAEENERINFVPTVSLEAYDEFAKGRQKIAGRNADLLQEARAHFERAVELDPEFSLAYTGLAETITLLVDHGARRLGRHVRT